MTQKKQEEINAIKKNIQNRNFIDNQQKEKKTNEKNKITFYS
jgi:hypothetical protein